jgi:GcrA cell cycle regulator
MKQFREAGMAWTDDRVELLKRLWLEGLSASQIAGELGEGVTRNAVIGKVHRLKLSGRAKPTSSAPRARKPRTGVGGQRRVVGSAIGKRRMINAPMIGATALQISPEDEQDYIAERAVELYIPPEERVSLLALTERTCKWPIGDPMSEGFFFCGRDSEEDRPYCEFHSRRAYHQLDRRRR